MRLLPFCLLVLACSSDTAIKRTHQAPTVAIVAPLDGASFRQGSDALALQAHVEDSFDPPERLAVSLAVDDAAAQPLAADAQGDVLADIDATALALGTHTLSVTVTDTDGDASTASVDIVIGGPLGAPDVHITEPVDGAESSVGDTVAFRGEASDLTTPADDLVFAWSSSLDGPLADAISGGGASALLTDALSPGEHQVTLTATDADGEIGSDTITVVVAEEEVIPEPGDVVFSEMMVNPSAVEDEVGEWVELYNTSGSTLDIGGYSFRDDDVDLQILAGPLLVAPHDYVVLCASVDPSLNGGVPCDAEFRRVATGGGLALANGEDELVLARPDGVEIDWLHYDETWYTIGVALGLDPDALDGTVNDDPAYWCDQVTVTAPMTDPGTPGAPNDPCGMR